MHGPRRLVPALTLLVALLIAACGGQDSQAGQNPPTERVAAQARSTDAPATADPSPTPTEERAQPTSIPTEDQGRTVGGNNGGGAGSAVETVAPEPAEEPTATPTKERERDPKPAREEPTATPTPEPTNTPTPEPTATPELAEPARLIINTDDLKVNAAVEHVGKTPEGAMDVPKAWENVAWFEPGYEPGATGNAVMAGHLDTDDPNNPCAVFCYLNKIDKGDEVAVQDETGKMTRFRVTKVELFDADNAPLYEIFGPSDTAGLNLITCDGAWDQNAQQYDKRLVVFTEKIAG